MGENETFVGGEGVLQQHGVEVVNLGPSSRRWLSSDSTHPANPLSTQTSTRART